MHAKAPFKIETKIGNVWVTPTQKDHIYVDFGTNLNVEEEGPGGCKRRGPVTVRGAVYAGSIHAYLWSDGKWHIGQERKSSYEQAQSLYLSRACSVTYSASHASHAARKTVAEVVMPSVQTWADDNPGMILAADEDHRAYLAERKRERIAELHQQIAQLMDEITALEVA